MYGDSIHKYLAKGAKTNTGTINLARVTLSDLENDTETVMINRLEFPIFLFIFFTFCYQPFCPFPKFSCTRFLFYFRHLIKFINSKKQCNEDNLQETESS